MQVGRIIQEHKTNYLIATDDGDLFAVVRGTFHEQKGFPKVGDYVSYTIIDDKSAVIEDVRPRRTEVIRTSQARNKIDGDVLSEVLVANVDIMFIVMGLDNDFNASRAERYATLSAQSNVRAVLILNKSDTVADTAPYLREIHDRLPNLPVHVVSAANGTNMEAMLEYLNDDTTAVLLGSSGAGKSTITNWLLNRDAQLVGGVREDDNRGRHTTTARELFIIPTGGFLIDTPGMRELGIVGETEDVFTPIEELAAHCQFNDCDHQKSIGCAVQKAIEDGDLPEEQLANYLKLLREQKYVASKASKVSERKFNDDKKKQAKKGLNLVRSKYKSRGVK